MSLGPKCRIICLLSIFVLAAIGNAYGYGKSVEDLVGVFSIEKNIKLGSSADCFRSSENANDPSNPMVRSNIMDDDQAPTLADFDIESPLTDGLLCQFHMRAHVIDDQSGMNVGKAWFRSPSGQQLVVVRFMPRDRISGTSQDGIYSANLTLPISSERGVWRLDNLTLTDYEGNQKILNRQDLVPRNLTTEIFVF